MDKKFHSKHLSDSSEHESDKYRKQKSQKYDEQFSLEDIEDEELMVEVRYFLKH